MDAKVKQQATKTPERKKKLNALRNINGIYDELIDRICQLTPHRQDVVDETKMNYPQERWDALMLLDIQDSDAKDDLKIFFSLLFTRLSQMSSVDEMQVIKKYTTDMMLAIDLSDGTTQELGARFLQICHDFIDRIEKKISEVLHMQKGAKNKQEGSVRGAKGVDGDDDKRSAK